MADNQERLEIDLTLSTKDIDKAFARLGKQAETLRQKTINGLEAMEEYPTVLNNSTANAKKLKDIVQRINALSADGVKATKENQEELKTLFVRYSKIANEQKTINALSSKAISLNKQQILTTDKLAENYAEARRQVEFMQGSFKELGSKTNLSKLQNELDKIKKTEQEIAKLGKLDITNPANITRLNKLNNELAQTKSRVKDLNSELEKDSGGLNLANIAKRAVAYSALFAVISAGTLAIREAIKFTLEYDSAVLKLGVIMDVTTEKAEKLEMNLVNLSIAYGEQLKNLNLVALELGRAGVAYEDLAQASEVVIKLALLTGDSIDQSASSVVSFLQVFGKDKFGQATRSVNELGSKLAFLANSSRLTTQDINTFANFALASSKSVGLTIDAVNGLASSFSNAGFNASTIGTQIRRFTTLLNDDSNKVQNFFQRIGVNQKNLARSLAQGGQESNEALKGFLDQIKDFSKESFNEALTGIEILGRNVLQAMQNNARDITSKINDSISVTANEIDKAKKITESYEKTWIKFGQNAQNIANSVFDPLVNGATSFARAFNEGIRLIQDRDVLSEYFGSDFYTSSFQEGSRKLLTDVKNLREEINSNLDSISQTEVDNIARRAENLKNVLEALLFRAENSNAPAEALAKLSDGIRKVNKLIKEVGGKGISQIVDENETKKQLKNLEASRAKLQEYLKTLSPDNPAYVAYQNSLKTIESTIKNLRTTIDRELAGKKGTLIEQIFSKDDLIAVQARVSGIRKTLKFSDKDTKGILTQSLDQELQALDEKAKKVFPSIRKELATIGKESLVDGVSLQNINKVIAKIQQERNTAERAISESSGTTLENAKKQVSSYDVALGNLRNIRDSQAEITNAVKDQDVILGNQIKKSEKLQKLEEDRLAKLRRQNEIREDNGNKTLARAEELFRKDQQRLGLIDKAENEDIRKQRIKLDLLLEQNKITVESYEQTLRQLQLTEDLRGEYQGIDKAIAEYQAKLPTINQSLENVANIGIRSLEDAMGNFLDTSSDKFLKFGDLAKSVIGDIARQMLKNNITRIAGDLISSFAFDAPSGQGQQTTSSGARLSDSPSIRKANGGFLPSSPDKKFANGGLLTGGSGKRDDLFMGSVGGSRVFAMGGEFFTKKTSVNPETRPTLEYINKNGSVPNGGGVAVSTPVEVNIQNNTSNPIDESSIQETFKTDENGERKKVINIVLNEARTNLNFRNAIQGR